MIVCKKTSPPLRRGEAVVRIGIWWIFSKD